VVGGLAMNDHGEADDKIIAVLNNDSFWANVADIDDLPPVLVERLRHYFSTYKMVHGEPHQVSIERIYGRVDAENVIKASMADYQEEYGE
jgi:inorganic pyrophosphatase